MSSSSHSTRMAFFAAAVIATAATTAAGHGQSATASRLPGPNWEHIRILGGQLGVPRTIAVGAAPSRSVAVADFDGDGDADIAVGAGVVGRVVVLLGDGSGRFGSSITAARSDWPTVDADTEVDGVRYRAQSSVVSSSAVIQGGAAATRRSSEPAVHFAAVADFNGDLAVDLAAAPAGSPDLLVYLGRVGDGLNAPDRIALAAPATALATGDFDHDGSVDLVVANDRSSLVTLLYGDGHGGFARRRAVDVGIEPAPGGLAPGDVDADGLADLVVVGHRSGEVNVLLGTGGGNLTLVDRVVVDDVPQDRTALAKDFAAPPSAIAVASGSETAYEGIASLVLNPATIAGGSGATSTGTITLNASAPAGGVVVTITSSNQELAASIPSITVPEGASTAAFIIGTNQNYRRYSGLAFNVTISAAHGTTTQSATLQVTAQPRPGTLSSFDVQNEGQMCFGVGVRKVGDNITLEFGSAGNLFECVPPDNPVGQDGTCTFRQECALGCERRPPVNGSRFSDVCATTGPFPVAVNPKLLVGGYPSLGTLQLNAPAPASSSGILSSFTVLANAIPNVSTPIPAGATTANAEVLTARVNSPQFAPIDGSYYTPQSDGSVGGRIGLTWLALVPGTPPPFRLTSFNFDSSSLTSVVGGTAHVMLAQMNQVAPAPEIATVTMTLSSNNPSVASFAQPEVSFTHGSSSRGVVLQTHAVAADTVVTLSAAVGATTLTRELTVRATPAATRVDSFFLDPFDVPGGTSSTGLVVLNGSAPAGGAVVTLVSANTAVATMPPSVTVPAGSDRVSFAIATSPVSSNTSVTLTANFNGTWTATSLIVTPTSGAASLSLLALSPSTVTGGASSQGTVTLSGPAPTGGAVVSLASSSSVAGVPSAVTVASGATSATFTATTTAVTTSTVATVTGTLDGTSRTANLTITPAGGGGAPGFHSPTADAPDSGGDGNGFQSSPGSAYADDAAVATDTNSGSGTSTSCTNSAKDRHRFSNYGFSIPTDVTVTGIEVRLDARADSTSGSPRMCVQLSWNGGTTWTTAKATATLGTSMTTFTLGSATDTWGRTWSPTDFANATFRVRVINVAGSTSRDFFLDWVAVRPHYTTSAPAGLNAVSVSPSTVTGGSPSTGTVTLTAAAPAGGFPVTLSSTSSAATVPASVTVGQGATSATFAITTTTVTTSTAVTITASAGGMTRTTTLTVTPPPPPASLSAVSLNPTSVVGGTSSQGTVTLTSAAPAGGLTVTLSSNNTAATVPGSVTVAAGATTASFTATTTAVGASTPVTITATNAGVTRTASLTVTPPTTTVPLTVTATGRSGERVTSSPTGINVTVGSSGSAAFAVGTQITLRVTNGRDAIWSGACSSGGGKTATCTFTLNAAASVSANVQ